MCILCNSDSLRLLVAPRESLSFPDLAEAVRVAREAAIQLALDAADDLQELDGPEAALQSIVPDEYIRYVVDRAERDGVADDDEVREWNAALGSGSILLDPRVQAFLSSSTEGLALYLDQIRAKQTVLERFLEVYPGSGTASFGGIGACGEISFEYGDQRYVVLSEEEGLQIAIDYISNNLSNEDPGKLLRYSNLPEDALDILAAAQERPQEEANRVLGGMVDVTALAEDTIRQTGYAPFLTAETVDDFTEQRFGELLIIRMRLTDAPYDEA